MMGQGGWLAGHALGTARLQLLAVSVPLPFPCFPGKIQAAADLAVYADVLGMSELTFCTPSVSFLQFLTLCFRSQQCASDVYFERYHASGVWAQQYRATAACAA